MAGLVLFLDNEDINVVVTALEVCLSIYPFSEIKTWKFVTQIFMMFFQALKFLSEFQPNRSKMRDEIGMVISLKTVMHKEGYNAKARQMAKEVYQNIIPPVNPASNKRTR